MSEKILDFSDRANTKENTKVIAENSITDEQVSQVYNKLEEGNKDAKVLHEAEQASNNNEDIKLDKLNSSDDTVSGAIDVKDINEKEDNYKSAFNPYDLPDDQAQQLLEAIYNYKNGKNINDLYNQLPAKIQKIADGFYTSSKNQGQPTSKNNCAKFIIESFINDAKMDKAIQEYQEEIEKTLKSIDSAYGDIYRNAMDEIFNQIDEIKEKDPSRADRLQAIKNAFEDASTFNKQLEYLDKTTAKKLNKILDFRYDDRIFYFNKKVNVTEVRIPDVMELIDIISTNLPNYEEDIIKKFIIVLIESTDINELDQDVIKLAYVYRLINNIYDYKFYVNDDSEQYKIIFGNITKVLEKIKALK